MDGKALTAAELKVLVDTLEKAEKALVRIAGLKSSYEAVVNAKYAQNDYMEDTWAALQKAQADAKAILDRDAAKARKGGTITTTVYCPSHAPIVRKTTATLKNAAETLAEIGFKAEKVEEKVLPGWSRQMKVEIAEWIRLDKSCKTTYFNL